MAMAQWVSVPALWPRPMLPTQQPQAPTVQSLPPPDLDHRRHHLRLHQAAPDGVVSGHLPHDPGQQRGLGDEAAPPSGYLLQRRVADQTQADAGDDGARPRAPAQRVDPARRRLSRWRAKRRQARSWRARQDALCRRRRDQRAGTPVAHEAHRRRGLELLSNLVYGGLFMRRPCCPR